MKEDAGVGEEVQAFFMALEGIGSGFIRSGSIYPLSWNKQASFVAQLHLTCVFKTNVH